MTRCVILGLVLVAIPASPGVAADTASPPAADAGGVRGKLVSALLRQSNAVVYLADVAGKFEPAAEKPVMDQREMLYLPRVLPVLVGSTVAFPNNDSVQHNVYSKPPTAKQFNLGMYGSGETRQVTFDRVGVVPLLCNVHSEMAAYIVVLPNPFFSVTDKRGNFAIKNVPAGTHTIAFWHEKLSHQTQRVAVKAGEVSDVTFDNLKTVPYSGVELAVPKSK